MRKRIVSVCLAAALMGSMSTIAAKEVRAADEKQIDDSKLTHERESVGYDTKITRGVYLLTGYSKITKLGTKKIYAGGTTVAVETVDNVQIGVTVERAKEEDTSWELYTGWQKKNLNTDRVSSNKTLYVDGGYYYRVRCIHTANGDMSSSFTNGIYIE